MRHKLLGLAAGLIAGAFANSAMATVDVTANITKTKDVTVTVDVVTTKTVDIFVVMGTPEFGTGGALINIIPFPLTGAAEAHAIMNVENTNNEVGPDLGDGLDEEERLVERDAYIQSTVLENSGIVGVNQDTGDNNNQGNIAAIAFNAVPDGFVNSQSGGEQINTNNTVFHTEQFDNRLDTREPTGLPNDVWHTLVRMRDSVNDNVGVVGVNQNGGNNNNQTNGLALAVGVDPVLALAEAALGQENAHNQIVAFNTAKKDYIFNSVKDNLGVVGVNQASGHNNNQSGSLSISAATNSHTTFGSLLTPQ